MIFLILLLCFLLGFSAFLSGSETALFSLSSLQLKVFKQSKKTRFSMIAHLMERPRDVLVTILMLNMLCNILVQNVVSSIFDRYSEWGLKVGLPLGLTLIFGELLPKSIAIPNNRRIAYRVSPIISKVARFLGPIRKFLTKLTNWISGVFFLVLKDEPEISLDELRHVLKTSEESGVLLKEESRLIGGAIDLQQTLVREQMRPREEIIYYDIRGPISNLIDLFTQLRVTRIPVCEDSLENLLGVLSIQDFFLQSAFIRQGSDLKPILKKAHFVPETMKASALLSMQRSKGIQLSIVVDEYGTISGLITQEDLIESVVGEILDRRGTKSLYTQSSEDVLIASGKMELSDLSDLLGVEFESKENVVTIGGWLIEQMGSIPPTGTKFATDQFLFYVLAADPNRIRRIYIRKLRKKA